MNEILTQNCIKLGENFITEPIHVIGDDVKLA